MENVVIKNLKKTYHDSQRGEVKAVNDVNFSCNRGEIFGLLGPNGAGKSTTLRIISTLIKPDDGDALINDFSIHDKPEKVRESIGYLSTTTSLYPRLTPRETLRYFAELNNYSGDDLEKRINDVIGMFEIEDYADTITSKFSTGMKQITSIARCIIHDPPILILDEPNSGLDVIMSVKMHNMMKKQKELNKTIIFSTHNMAEAEKLCDRIAIINKGEILACGTLDELREKTKMHYLEDIFMKLVGKTELVDWL